MAKRKEEQFWVSAFSELDSVKRKMLIEAWCFDILPVYAHARSKLKIACGISESEHQRPKG
jgi:hypothetical protein